jgi:hypothetical protein
VGEQPVRVVSGTVENQGTLSLHAFRNYQNVADYPQMYQSDS